jgi:hypothetical protein
MVVYSGNEMAAAACLLTQESRTAASPASAPNQILHCVFGRRIKCGRNEG